MIAPINFLLSLSKLLNQLYFSGNYNAVNSFQQRSVIPSNNLFLQKDERIVSPDELDLYHQFLFGKNWYIEQYPKRRKPRCTTYICSWFFSKKKPTKYYIWKFPNNYPFRQNT